MTLAQGQYGGNRAPAVAPTNGGASVLSNMASGAFGMLTAGGLPAIQAAMDVAKDQPTQQNPTSTNNQSTGSKVFNLAPAGNAMQNNPFWVSQMGGGSSMPMVLLIGIFAIIGLIVWRSAK